VLASRAMNGEYAVGWGTLALINAALAQSKNRSGLSWFCGSLIAGPLATLLLVLADPRPIAAPKHVSRPTAT
jgi:hypothetical protein